MELSLGLFFGNQGQIGQPLSEEISLLKCSSRSKQKILGLHRRNTYWYFIQISMQRFSYLVNILSSFIFCF